MKNMKIWSLAIMFILALTACEKNPNNQNNGPTPGPGSTEIVNEWAITSWNGAEPAFNVYIDFNADGTFSMYQQVYSLDYVLYTGKYTVSGDILSGTYADGSNWQCAYKVSVTNNNGVDEMTLVSQEDVSIVSVYVNQAIPEDIKAEAAETRAMDVVRFL